MPTTYYKRYRMEFDLRRTPIPAAALPDGYSWMPWHPSLNQAHAAVKFQCFRGEMDAHVFGSLGDIGGCRRLMSDISSHEGFVPAATWLVRFVANEFRHPTLCGTIQGLRRSRWLGAVQNIGVIPEHRGLGLGRALLLRSLAGFKGVGLQRVTLEVTAANEPAVELYRTVGFQLVRTSYREVTTPSAPRGTADARSGKTAPQIC